MPEFTLESFTFGKMPYVVVRDPNQTAGPVVIVQHGFTGSIETEIPYGKRFAELGYTAIVTEAEHHGKRKNAEADARFAVDHRPVMGEIVEASLRDIEGLLDQLGVSECGYFGISMGGFIGYRLASEDRRVKSVCPLISMPISYWADQMPDAERIKSMDPSLHPERLAHCSILIQNGLADEVIPIEYARKLYEDLKSYLPPERCRMIEYPGVGHEVPEAMVTEALSWMQTHLPV